MSSFIEAVPGLRRDPPQANAAQCATGRDLANYFDQVEENYRDLSDTFDRYRELVDGLIDIDRRMLHPACDLLDAASTEHPLVALRHDIDADPITAVRMARYLARVGAPGTFYLLPTALYYGTFHDHAGGKLFVRQAEVVDWVKALIVAGCETGVHNDAFGAIVHHGADGPRFIASEIAWLRAIGARIVGTAGHNALPTYGAENSEVFSGRKLWARRVAAPDGGPLPLGALSERELELTYEGTFAAPRTRVSRRRLAAFLDLSGSIRDEAWMRAYLTANPYCRWMVDIQIWIVGRDRWAIGGEFGRNPVFQWDASLAQVLDFVRTAPAGRRILFVLHPEYLRR